MVALQHQAVLVVVVVVRQTKLVRLALQGKVLLVALVQQTLALVKLAVAAAALVLWV
jgi:hypothetical protein